MDDEALRTLDKLRRELARARSEFASKDRKRDAMLLQAQKRHRVAEYARQRGQEALEQIVACDYRGNMPREQQIAAEALKHVRLP